MVSSVSRVARAANDCVDDRACVYNMYTGLRYALLVINCLVIVLSLVLATLVYRYWQNKVKLHVNTTLLYSPFEALGLWEAKESGCPIETG